MNSLSAYGQLYPLGRMRQIDHTHLNRKGLSNHLRHSSLGAISNSEHSHFLKKCDPGKVMYSQPTISDHIRISSIDVQQGGNSLTAFYKNHRSRTIQNDGITSVPIINLLNDIINGNVKIEDIPPPAVHKNNNGQLISEDNRRLYLFKTLAQMKLIDFMFVREALKDELDYIVQNNTGKNYFGFETLQQRSNRLYFQQDDEAIHESNDLEHYRGTISDHEQPFASKRMQVRAYTPSSSSYSPIMPSQPHGQTNSASSASIFSRNQRNKKLFREYLVNEIGFDCHEIGRMLYKNQQNPFSPETIPKFKLAIDSVRKFGENDPMINRVEFAALNTIKNYVADPHQFMIFDKKEEAKNVLETLLESKNTQIVRSSRDSLKTLLEKEVVEKHFRDCLLNEVGFDDTAVGSNQLNRILSKDNGGLFSPKTIPKLKLAIDYVR